jgi:hypothetical protein
MMREFTADDQQLDAIPAPAERRKARAGRWKRAAILMVLGIGLFAIAAIAGAYVYWQTKVETPQYSLALLVDAARRNDAGSIDRLVDTDAVVADFVPQVTDKAVEIYGRGVSPKVIARVSKLATPVMPALSDRVRRELPRVIAERTAAFSSVPFPVLVLGADRYLLVALEGDRATVRMKDPDHPTEVVMKRSGDHWTIVKLRDPQLAEEIAQAVGQEMLRIAARPETDDITDVLKSAERILSGRDE